ncbi:hypothetical protein BMS3Abin05_01495 [bacterium BMS3Abin05]|nr:hypothetical protein BMS3Abin05_01495 [bacterium BMS3Abin05]GBE27071.1 hypothetical protein BMS3Bbin03_00991 [bacterium BMS3Bbin03]
MRNTKSNQKLGKTGEQLAGRYLQKNGYRILERNFRSRHGEIDIIVKKDDVLVFVEVKTSYSCDEEDPVLRVDRRKRRHLGQAGEAYLALHGLDEQDVRYDIITVQFEKGKPVINHFEDAFWLEPEDL